MQADLNALVGQFVISRAVPAIPNDWQREEMEGWHLAAHSTTRVVSLVDELGHRVGWLLGEAWHGSQMLEDILFIPTRSFDVMEETLYDLGGPWLAFIPTISQSEGRVYCDAFGHLSVLYSVEQETVATAPVLISGAERDDELSARFNIPAKDNWYPFGLTGYRNIRRLLPNHYLDLATWVPLRHWPVGDPRLVTLDQAAAEIAQLSKTGIDALATRYPLQASLTAGYDSRMVVACARRHASKMKFVTNNSHPKTGAIDIAIAKRLASRNGFDHVIRDVEESSDEERRAWLQQTGAAGAGAAFRHLRLTNRYGTQRARLSGQAGGVLKGSYHSYATKDYASDYGAEELVELLRLPTNRSVMRAADNWIIGLQELSGADLLDLLYLEQRLACWAGPLRFGGTSAHRVFWPEAHRRVLELARGLPIASRSAKEVHLRVIKNEWPELLDVPFNSPVGWLAVTHSVRSSKDRARFFLGALKRNLAKSLSTHFGF